MALKPALVEHTRHQALAGQQVNMSRWPLKFTSHLNLLIFMSTLVALRPSLAHQAQVSSQMTTPCSQSQQQHQQDYETTKTEASLPTARYFAPAHRYASQKSLGEQVRTAPLISGYSYAPPLSSSTPKRRDQQRENDRRLGGELIWPPRQFDDDDDQDEMLLLVDSSHKANSSADHRLAYLKVDGSPDSPELSNPHREERNISATTTSDRPTNLPVLHYRPFERPVVSRLSMSAVGGRPEAESSSIRPIAHLTQHRAYHLPARLVSNRIVASQTPAIVAFRDLLQRRDAALNEPKTSKLGRLNAKSAILLKNGVKVRNELLFSPESNVSSSVDLLAGSGPSNHSSARPSPYIIDLEEGDLPQHLVLVKPPPNVTSPKRLFSAQLLPRLDSLPDVEYSLSGQNNELSGVERLPVVAAPQSINSASLYLNAIPFEARQNELDGSDEDDYQARVSQYSSRRYEQLNRGLPASSTGIRVIAGQSPRPLVINSNGLIVAAKKNVPGRPYNPSALQTTNQMEHSLSPIQSGDDSSVPEDDDYNGAQGERPSFLRKPLIISNTLWGSDNSSQYANHRLTNTTTLQQTYNLTANSGPFQIYTSNHSSSNSGLLTPVHSDSVNDSNGDHPIYNEIASGAVNAFHEEPQVSSQQSLPTLNVTSVANNRTNQSSGQNPASFHHNPPYTKLHQGSPKPSEQSDNSSLSLAEQEAENCAKTTTTVAPTTPRPPAIKQAQTQRQQVNHTGTAGSRKPAPGSYELSAASSSQHVNRYNQTVKNTASPETDTSTTMPMGYPNSNSTMSPAQLSDIFVQRYQVNSTTTLKPSKVKSKLQHMLIAKILKNQASSGPTQQLSAPATPPPLLSSTVANNVASLLAQKLGALVRPALSLNSLFGIRVGSGAASAGTGLSRPVKQRINPFTGADNHQGINRRTAGVGSLLLSGFVYGLSVLPALMALTGINPLYMEPDGGVASPSSLAAAVVNRHGNSQAEKRRKRLMARRPPLPLASDPLSPYPAYLLPYAAPSASPLGSDELEFNSASSGAVDSQAAQSVQSAATSAFIGPPATSMSELQSILEDPDQPAPFAQPTGSLRNHLHYSQSFAPTPSNSWLEQQLDDAPSVRQRHLRDLERWPASENQPVGLAAQRAARSNPSENRKPFVVDDNYELEAQLGKNSPGNQYHHRDTFEEQSPTANALLTQFPSRLQPQQYRQRPLKALPSAGDKRAADSAAVVQLALEHYLLANSLVNHQQERLANKASVSAPIRQQQQEQRHPIDGRLGTRPPLEDGEEQGQRGAEFPSVALDGAGVRDPYSSQSGEESMSANYQLAGEFAGSSRHRGRRTLATNHTAGETAVKPVITNRPAPILFGTVLPDVAPPRYPFRPTASKLQGLHKLDSAPNLTDMSRQFPGHPKRGYQPLPTDSIYRHSKLMSGSPTAVDVKGEMASQWRAVTTRPINLPDLSQESGSFNKGQEPNRWSGQLNGRPKKNLSSGKAGDSARKRHRKRPPRTTTETPMFLGTEPDLLMAHTMAMGSRVLNERL